MLLIATLVLGAVLVAPATSVASVQLFLSCATHPYRQPTPGDGCSRIPGVELLRPASWEELSKPGVRSIEIRLPSSALERCPLLRAAVEGGQSLSGVELADATPGSSRVAHPGTVQFALGDGSVRTISSGVSVGLGDGSVRSHHSGGANFVMGDGSVHFIKLTLRFVDLRLAEQ